MSKSLNEETKIKKKEKFNWWELFKLLPSYLTVIVAASTLPAELISLT